jgi:hypothetical protein
VTVRPSDAGRDVRCPHCGALHVAPRLSFLHRLPIMAALADEPAAVQSGLQTLFGFVAFLVLSLGFFCCFGLRGLVPAVLVPAACLGAALWGRAFVNVALIGCVVCFFITLTFQSLLHAREDARRMTFIDHLRQVNSAYQSASDYRSVGLRGRSFEGPPQEDIDGLIQRQGNSRDQQVIGRAP